jgi:hypothetical protein
VTEQTRTCQQCRTVFTPQREHARFWFAWRVTGDARAEGVRAFTAGHHPPHLMHSAAMTCMFCALTPASAGAADAMSGGSG